MPPGPDAALDWTAFLYISGDLAPDEEAAFERRLADDQAAREAVAGAVELAGTLTAIEPRDWPIPRARRPIARRALAWSGLAAAAILALATSLSLRPARVVPFDAGEVAMAWSDLRDLEPIGAEVDALELVEDAPALDLSTGPALPSWLQAAADEARSEAPRTEEN